MAIELTVVYLYIKSTQVLLNQYSIPSLKVKSIDLLNYIRYLHTGGCYGTPQHNKVLKVFQKTETPQKKNEEMPQQNKVLKLFSKNGNASKKRKHLNFKY